MVGEKIIRRYPDGTEAISKAEGVTDALKEYITSYENTLHNTSLFNGLLGFTAYDAVRYFEPSVPVRGREEKLADIPDMQYLLYRFIIQVNHFRNEMTIIENIPEGDSSRSEELLSIIRNNNIAIYPFHAKNDLESPVTDEEYIEMVRRGIAHAKRGDVFQIVPSRRFSQGFTGMSSTSIAHSAPSIPPPICFSSISAISRYSALRRRLISA